MCGEARADPFGGYERRDVARRLVDKRVRVRRIELDQFVEDDRGKLAANERLERDERVGDVANNHRAGGDGLLDRMFDRLENFWRSWIRPGSTSGHGYR